MREHFANKASNTLSATITGADTSLTLTDASAFPTSGQFRILCDAEIMLVTAVATNTFTVVRAQEGTTAAGHTSGATVTQILTVSGLQRWGRDNVPCWDGTRAPYRLVDSSGNTLASSDFTGVNDASYVTITDSSDGSISMVTSASGYSVYVIALARAMPTTKQLIAAIRPVIQSGPTAGYMNCFVGFRESATGKLEIIGVENYNGSHQTRVRQFASPTSLSATPFDASLWIPGQDAVFFKLVDDSTNLNFYVGDGENWILVYSETLANFFTTEPDQFIFGTNAGNTKDIINRIVAWQEG